MRKILNKFTRAFRLVDRIRIRRISTQKKGYETFKYNNMVINLIHSLFYCIVDNGHT